MNRQAGFSIIEIILATAIFSLLAGALAGIVIYGQVATAQAGDRLRAHQLAEEGLEAARSIRDASYASLADGTYGLAQSGGVWTLAGSSDVKGIYTRQVVIATGGTNRKNVTATVSWPAANGSIQTATASTRLTNWLAAVTVPKVWPGAVLSGSYDASGAQDGLKVATAGNYAYVVRNTGTPNFLIVNISNPAAPTLAGSLSLSGNPTNIFVNGNYAYVTNSVDTAELQVVNITAPASPSLTGSYNATGGGNGQAVFVSGALAYVVRAADTTTNAFELTMVNVGNPAALTLAGGYNNNISMASVSVDGMYAHIGTNSTTTELLHVNVAIPALPSLAGSTNLTTSGTVNDLEISGNVMLASQAATLSVLNFSSPTALTRSTTVTAAGNINDITVGGTTGYAFLGTAAAAAEFQVISISTPASASVVRTVDLASTLNGVAYNSSLDVVAGSGASDTQEVTTFVKN